MEQRIIHILCFKGECSVHFSRKDYILSKGKCLVAVETHVHNIMPEKGSIVRILYLSQKEHSSLMPDTTYGICGELHLFANPVFTIEDKQLRLIERDLEIIEQRSDNYSGEYENMARNKAIELFYVDLLHAHESIFGKRVVSDSYAIKMNQFISLLKSGTCLQERSVEYYAGKLCITSKHLHKICRQVSGQNPSYWIRRFTVLAARYMIRRENRTQKEVAAILGFDNVSHFNRYMTKSE